MITIPKKQASLILIVTAFAAIMFAGPIALNGVNSAFVYGEDFFFDHHHHHHFFFNHHHRHHHFDHHGFDGFDHFSHHGEHSHIHQSIFQGCNQHQRSIVLTAGAFSPVVNSGNDAAGCANVNLGGNAAASDQSSHE